MDEIDSLSVVQGSAEWFTVKLGKVSASRIGEAMARDKSRKGWGMTRDRYMGELIAERKSGVPTERFSNDIMKRGNVVEPKARLCYELMRDVDVTQVGFVHHPSIAMAGASPDGLVGVDGIVQIKCPLTHTHIDTLRRQAVPTEYIKQMQWELACSERQWCDFVSYEPRLLWPTNLFVKRIVRNRELIEEMERYVRIFLADLDEAIAFLDAYRPQYDLRLAA